VEADRCYHGGGGGKTPWTDYRAVKVACVVLKRFNYDSKYGGKSGDFRAEWAMKMVV